MIASFEKYHGSKPSLITKKEDMSLILNSIDNALKRFLTNSIGLSTSIINFNININSNIEERLVEGVLITDLEEQCLLDNFMIPSKTEAYEFNEESKLWEERTPDNIGERLIQIYKENFADSITKQDRMFLESAGKYI